CLGVSKCLISCDLGRRSCEDFSILGGRLIQIPRLGLKVDDMGEVFQIERNFSRHIMSKFSEKALVLWGLKDNPVNLVPLNLELMDLVLLWSRRLGFDELSAFVSLHSYWGRPVNELRLNTWRGWKGHGHFLAQIK